MVMGSTSVFYPLPVGWNTFFHVSFLLCSSRVRMKWRCVVLFAEYQLVVHGPTAVKYAPLLALVCIFTGIFVLPM